MSGPAADEAEAEAAAGAVVEERMEDLSLGGKADAAPQPNVG